MDEFSTKLGAAQLDQVFFRPQWAEARLRVWACRAVTGTTAAEGEAGNPTPAPCSWTIARPLGKPGVKCGARDPGRPYFIIFLKLFLSNGRELSGGFLEFPSGYRAGLALVRLAVRAGPVRPCPRSSL